MATTVAVPPLLSECSSSKNSSGTSLSTLSVLDLIARPVKPSHVATVEVSNPFSLFQRIRQGKHFRRFKTFCFRHKQPNTLTIKTQVSYNNLNRTITPPTPLSHALQNCQKTYIVVETLRNLLLDLLRQQSAKSACGCDLGITDQSPTDTAYKLECALKNEERQGRFNDDPQTLRQMRRICRWTCEEIKDELRALQIMIQYGKCRQYEAERNFILRWQAWARPEYDSIMLLHRDPRVIQMLDLAFLLADGATNTEAVHCAIAYLPTLHNQHRQSQRAYRGINSKPSEYGPSPSTLVKMINANPPFHDVQARTVFRCRSNLKTIKHFLQALVKESKFEIARRLNCKHPPTRRHGHRDCGRHLELAAEQLNLMISRLTVVEKAIDRLEACQQQCSDADKIAVKHWCALSGNFFGGLVALRLQEVVERLVRMPLWEDRVLERDEILKNIPYRMRPISKYAL